MKRKKSFVLIVTVALVLLVASWGVLYYNSFHKMNVFLRSIYTTDNDRLESLLIQDSFQVSDAELKTIYRDIYQIYSDAVFNALMSNRVPYKYDFKYMNDPYEVKKISLYKKSDYYDYDVTCSNGSDIRHYLGSIDVQDGVVNYFFELSTR